jgi:hypothetical protein
MVAFVLVAKYAWTGRVYMSAMLRSRFRTRGRMHRSTISVSRADRIMITDVVDALQARARRRRWSDDVEAAIVAESYGPGASERPLDRPGPLSTHLKLTHGAQFAIMPEKSAVATLPIPVASVILSLIYRHDLDPAPKLARFAPRN